MKIGFVGLAIGMLASPAWPAPFHPFCTDQGYCINRPGYVMDGFKVGSDDRFKPVNMEGGTVTLGVARATPVTIVEAGDGVVVFTLHGVAYVTTTQAAWVRCDDRAHWLGTATFPFACPE